MKVKIYTMTHKKFSEPEDPTYIPLHVGRAASGDLGYQGDDTGDNISEDNCFFGELTGYYWIWRNETEADIIGICHYRRFFVDQEGRFLKASDYERILETKDALISNLLSAGGTNYENYANAHNGADMDAVGEAIRSLYPEDYPAFEQVMADTKCCYGNLLVTTKEKFDGYCEWLFTILSEAAGKIDVSAYDEYHRRVFGFLSELLLMVYVTARGWDYEEGNIGVTAEKAETTEFKLAMTQLFKMGDMEQAKEIFYGYLKLRPDVRLSLSDIRGEIPVIEYLIYIASEEKKAGVAGGILKVSGQLDELIVYYKRAKDLLEKKKQGRISEAEQEELTGMGLSEPAKRAIERDISGNLVPGEFIAPQEKQIKVSVIVPVYNAEKIMMGCLGNLAHQTLQEIEIILVDDCSKDGSLAILQECQRQFPDRVKVIHSEKNRGAGGARNLGLDAARGEYIGFVDIDDLPDPAMFEKLYAEAKRGDYDVVDGGFIYESKEEMVLFTADQDVGETTVETRINLLARGGYIWSKLFRRSLLEEHHLRFRENCILEDDDFLNYIWAVVKSIGHVKEVIYRYKNTDDSLSKTQERHAYFQTQYDAMKANYDRLHVLDNYKDLQMVVEYSVLQLYSNAVNNCLDSIKQKEKFPAKQKLEEIRKLRLKIVKIPYKENKFVMEKMSALDVLIMSFSDLGIKYLLAEAKKNDWNFTLVQS